jgi:hypothetical protein
MIQDILSDILVFLSSTVKFALGASAVITADLGVDGTIANILGGMIGIVIFTYLGEYIRTWIFSKYPSLNKRFSGRTRFLVKIKRTFGLGGIAFITPIILSIPIGVLFALDMTTNKRKVVTSMLLACAFWSIVLFVPYFVFDIDVMSWIKHKF